MPEGPEIRRARDRIAAVLEGGTLVRPEIPWEALAPYERELNGAYVRGVESRGKAMLVHLCGGRTIYSHNQLYGVWRTSKTGVMPRSRRALRLALRTELGGAFLFSATDIELCDREDLGLHPYLRRLGPDVLDESTTPGTISRQLRSKPCVGRSLGALLLDQSALAGLGNYLRSEILYVAKLHPNLRPKDLSAAERRRLCTAVKAVTVRAYETGGVTLDARGLKKAKAEGGRRRKRHFVFARDGRECFRCGSLVEKVQKGGRRLYLCPSCQPKP